MKASFTPVTSPEQIARLARLADEIWHEYWPALIGEEQTDYMVEKFQSLEAITHDIDCNGYEYWFVKAEGDGRIVGFTGGHEESETERFFISKIYLLKDERGKGFASQTIAFYNRICLDRGLKAMYLTVNKRNELGLRAYRAKQFEVIESVVNDIGSGFVMDDYIMQRPALPKN